jgi:hypothetical protein
MSRPASIDSEENGKLLEQFTSLVTPNNINTKALQMFVTNLPYSKFGLFQRFNMVLRQNIYSSYDLSILATAISTIAALFHIVTCEAFEPRVTKSKKEAAIHASVRSLCCWRMLKNAILDPVVLTGSCLRDEKSYSDAWFVISNENFEEANEGNLG